MYLLIFTCASLESKPDEGRNFVLLMAVPLVPRAECKQSLLSCTTNQGVSETPSHPLPCCPLHLADTLPHLNSYHGF